MPKKSDPMPEASTPAASAATPGQHPLRRADDARREDEGLALARQDAVKYLHSRRQAMYALARHYHLDADDLQQEAYEVLLTCLRDFTPEVKRADGSTVRVLFNTFFGTRLEGKALEMRNRDPEYQARQAHLQDLSDEEKEQFRKDPPLLVQHLDQETTVQEHLRGEVAAAAQRNRTSVGLRILQDSFIEKKLNELIAAERDDKRRAALLHVKVGGVASFEEIAYHFGVTDSRASQILNDLMDAFYVQRLLDGDLKSVSYDFRKLKLQEKRALRLLEEALSHAAPERAEAIVAMFQPDYPVVAGLLTQLTPQLSAAGAAPKGKAQAGGVAPATGQLPFLNGPDLLTPAEQQQYPQVGMEWRSLADLSPVQVSFRPPSEAGQPDAVPAHIARLTTSDPEHWPILITDKGLVIDGQRRLEAARQQGLTRVFCHVIAVPDDYVATLLRVAVNLRGIRPDKPDLYWAISALLERGLSQQKISQLLGTSRPNVIVYAKVKEKASSELRQLFEDGLIQITNASTAVDLPPQAQRALVTFIRSHGADWGKGPRFNELYEAAAANKLDELAAAQSGVSQLGPQWLGGNHPVPSLVTEAPVLHHESNTIAPVSDISAPLEALRKRQQVLENAVRDAETWGRQREATIAQQTQQIIDMKSQIESLNRELQAAQLLQHGDSSTVQNYLKEIRNFHAIVERLAGAGHHVEKAARSVRSTPLTQRQLIEIEETVESITTHLNGLRTELVNRRRTPSG